MPEGAAVNQMFAGISRRYDVANHVLSGGVDYLWRGFLTRRVKAHAPRSVLDLATGTGDVALVLRRALPAETEIIGMDFCEPMLDEARLKAARLANPAEMEPALRFETGDAMALPLPDGAVDVVTIAFGVRNFEDRQRGLREMYRVVRPGGAALILEFSQPYAWFRPFYYFYLKTLLPGLAALVTRRKDAYEYLAGSIESFPSRPQLSAQVSEAGFEKVHAWPLTLGIVAVHEAVKAPAEQG